MIAYPAALRLQHELDRAREGNYAANGWYSYMSREDVEACVRFVLETTEWAAGAPKTLVSSAQMSGRMVRA